MANSTEERQKVRTAISLIENKYGNWIAGNARLNLLRNCHDPEFDMLVKFMDEQAFRAGFMSTMRRIPEGCQVNGFFTAIRIGQTPFQIYINRTCAREPTIIHELLHLLAHPDFTKNTSNQWDEGVTEYFTRKVQNSIDRTNLSQAGFLDPRQSYEDEFLEVNRIHGIITNVLNPYLLRIRQTPYTFGRQRMAGFVPDEYKGKSNKNFVKRAFFKGEMDMIKVLTKFSNMK
jgi:hypothetical protein